MWSQQGRSGLLQKVPWWPEQDRPTYRAARSISCLRSLRLDRRRAMLAGLVTSWFLAQPLAYADEFDAL
ncbi:hypothetical protein, partial [Microvirga vignae]